MHKEADVFLRFLCSVVCFLWIVPFRWAKAHQSIGRGMVGVEPAYRALKVLRYAASSARFQP
jgi:hypothetical protein